MVLPMAFAFLFVGIRGGGRTQADKLGDSAITVRKMRIRDWVFLVIFVSGIGAIGFTLAQHYAAVKDKSLREQFLLPPDIEFLNLRPGPSSGQKSSRTSYNAKVEFSPEQWEDYIAKVDNTELWEPKPLRRAAAAIIPFGDDKSKRRSGVVDGKYPGNARVWTDLPTPLKVDTEEGIYSYSDASWLDTIWGVQIDEIWKNESDIRPQNGKIMCYMFQYGSRVQSPLDFLWYDEDELQVPTTPPRASWDSKVTACSDLPRSEAHAAYVLGILDYDKRTLHMAFE